MGYAAFLTALFESGRVSLPYPSPLTDDEVVAGDGVIADFERLYRLEMPGHPPPLVPEAARFAGVRMFHACQFAVYRDVDKAAMESALAGECSNLADPAVHYSVDLLFRFLPDLAKLAAGVAEQDPLLRPIRRWAGQWPLSSVGMPDVELGPIDAIVADRSLLQLYADRIIATGDANRMQDIRVREAVEASLGMYKELASAALWKHE